MSIPNNIEKLLRSKSHEDQILGVTLALAVVSEGEAKKVFVSRLSNTYSCPRYSEPAKIIYNDLYGILVGKDCLEYISEHQMKSETRLSNCIRIHYKE